MTKWAMKAQIEGKRRQGHPCKRWSDDIISFLDCMYKGEGIVTTKWTDIASMKAGDWELHTPDFVRQHWS